LRDDQHVGDIQGKVQRPDSVADETRKVIALPDLGKSGNRYNLDGRSLGHSVSLTINGR
jgi:hypothetical protein